MVKARLDEGEVGKFSDMNYCKDRSLLHPLVLKFFATLPYASLKSDNEYAFPE